METYILPYVKWVASGNLLYDTASSYQCSVIGGMGWEVGGWEVGGWEVGGRFIKRTYV